MNRKETMATMAGHYIWVEGTRGTGYKATRTKMMLTKKERARQKRALRKWAEAIPKRKKFVEASFD